MLKIFLCFRWFYFGKPNNRSHHLIHHTLSSMLHSPYATSMLSTPFVELSVRGTHTETRAHRRTHRVWNCQLNFVIENRHIHRPSAIDVVGPNAWARRFVDVCAMRTKKRPNTDAHDDFGPAWCFFFFCKIVEPAMFNGRTGPTVMTVSVKIRCNCKIN